MFAPAALAIVLDQVEQERRTTASSIANLCFNALGYLPTPLIYTQVQTSYSDPQRGNQVAMAVTLSSNGVSTSKLIIKPGSLLPVPRPSTFPQEEVLRRLMGRIVSNGLDARASLHQGAIHP